MRRLAGTGFRRCALLLLLSMTLSQAEAQGGIQLPERSSGRKALALIGSNLASVARAHGMSPDHLRNHFENDPSLHIDRAGRLYYVEEAVSDEAPTFVETIPTSVFAVAIPPANAFLLNSRPGARRTIFLDFDGASLSNTAWNAELGTDPYPAGAFDTDGDPSTFNVEERNTIISVYRRVAEDFAPFDVNVTTQQPSVDALNRSSSNDQEFGIVALITKSLPVCSDNTTTCGGATYVGVYPSQGEGYKTALVFFDRLARHEKFIGESISHQIGHTLGLTHHGASTSSVRYQGHGTGETGWAPIMGVGYYHSITQWSKGEYSNANNPQDDISVLKTFGMPARTDDHGNTAATATVLDQGATFGVAGIIETTADVDYFRFIAGAGDVSLEVSPASVGANLDVKFTVYNQQGIVVAQADSAQSLRALAAFSSPAESSYVVAIEGVGLESTATGYTDYGSIGRYTMIGTVKDPSGNEPPTALVTASITSGPAPLTVAFSAADSGDVDGALVAHRWDFGDGASARDTTPEHTFDVGTHTVTLTVEDNEGATDTESISITVAEPPQRLARAEVVEP